ncbi:ADP-ribosylation factor-like 2 [Vigna unguiculata]|uniref:ADP-ribosylation factor-like protein 2 n=1 Tax=Vigna unguiculata TaxID=3917 RepID=A0A4D6LR19_VIGUN|nr:ADP-ribosylation factor-like 2 [Vigna unguiculata]
MGLLSIIRKIKRKEKEMRILMVGLDNSGKTTIVLKINGEDTSVISPTLGFNIKTIAYQKYTLNIWDVGGQKTIRSYWRNYFEQTDGLVWVVDSSDLRRLDDCKLELDNLLKEERLSGASLLILANKQDIKGALTPEEIAKVLNLEAMDNSRHWQIVGCSAYTGEGLLEGFDWLILSQPNVSLVHSISTYIYVDFTIIFKFLENSSLNPKKIQNPLEFWNAIVVFPQTKPFLLFHPSLMVLLFPSRDRKVLARMDSNNKQIDEQQPVKSASRVSFCQRKKSDNGSFVSNLGYHFHEFIQASADEHKTCLRNTIQKILDASNFFGKNDRSTNEGDSVPLHKSTKD